MTSRYERARLDRAQTMTKWLLGHAVEVDCDMNPIAVRVRVGDVVFEDPRVRYPSEKLIADIALCLDAGGYSRDAFSIGDFDDELVDELLTHAVLGIPPRYAIWYGMNKDMALDQALMFDGVRMP